MKRTAAICALGALVGAHLAGPAQADTLNVYDEGGAAMEIDTASMTGCAVVYDSAGDAFEICKLEKVEIRPPTSTRVRPGQSAGSSAETVVFTKSSD